MSSQQHPKKFPQNLHTPKIFFFLKTPKNIEIQNFEPQNMAQANVCKEITEYPPWKYNTLIVLSINYLVMNNVDADIGGIGGTFCKKTAQNAA